MAQAPLYLVGAAAVCTLISIAAFQILMGISIVALIVTRARWRVPTLWVPFSLFVAGTLISLAAHGHWRQGWPQIKKFYVYLMLVLVTSAFRDGATSPLAGDGLGAGGGALRGVGAPAVLSEV